jgi:polysaccharide chain length determinant protein (PEP-CTERM system associated)
LLLHRKWLIFSVFLAVSAATIVIARQLPDVYTSETVILVDAQKVPEAYVKSTVTGDVRNRLGTLSQQILSATRLQRIIDSLNLYPEDRKKMAREDLIDQMRKDISVSVVSDFGGSQDLQAFRISYSGENSRLVAQVTNELASLFIEENLKAREQQATGTTEFLQNQLQETRQTLEAQEAKLKDFKLNHIGEMPEQQTANLQILGQLQSQLQLEGEALARAEQQKTYIQSMMSQTAPVVDLDDGERNAPQKPPAKGPNPSTSSVNSDKARLAALLSRYTDDYPDVRKLRKQIETEEAKAKAAATVAEATPAIVAETPPPAPRPERAPQPVNYFNPVVQAQLGTVETDIAKRKEEVQRLSRSISTYQAKLEAIPVREQQITELVRDYEISKAHYSQLLEKQLSAETATQLEIRQKGEKFVILDPGQVAERPSRPNRLLIDSAGSVGGLLLGMLLAICTDFLGMSIISPQDIAAASGLPVLEVIPVIQTRTDRRLQKRRIVFAAVSAMTMVLAVCGILLFHKQI